MSIRWYRSCFKISPFPVWAELGPVQPQLVIFSLSVECTTTYMWEKLCDDPCYLVTSTLWALWLHANTEESSGETHRDTTWRTSCSCWCKVSNGAIWATVFFLLFIFQKPIHLQKKKVNIFMGWIVTRLPQKEDEVGRKYIIIVNDR